MTLAQPIVADMDFPPFDRAILDGYAVRSADVASAPVELSVVGVAPAGGTEEVKVSKGQAVQINTGGPMPPGADAVVMFEKTEPGSDSESVRILESAATGNAIMPRGREAPAGEKLLAKGTRLGPAQIAVAASCGTARVTVYPRPKVAILATGDELVEYGQRPGRGQIRNSNSPQLAAMVRAAGGIPAVLTTARDDPAHLRSMVLKGLEGDVLVLTGGVSMGTSDFVPQVLAEVGVRTHFHKVAIRPGKPTMFGQTDDGRHVFGLPGNPVSTFVCFHFFVRALLEGMSDRRDYWPASLTAALGGPIGKIGNRQSYIPAVVRYGVAEIPTATPTQWKGSGDPFGLARGNGLIERIAGAPPAEPGERVRVYPLGSVGAPIE